MSSLACPNCACPLIDRVFYGVSLATCPACGGVWFGAGQLERLRDTCRDSWTEIEAAVIARTPGLTNGAARYCPQCTAALFRYQYMYRSGILLDECNFCGGIWVDDGELTKMTAFLQEARAQAAQAVPPPYHPPTPQPPTVQASDDTVDRLVEESEIKDPKADQIASFVQLDSEIRSRFAADDSAP